MVLVTSKAMQQTLTDIVPSHSGFRDPAFGKNRELPVHRWVPWVAGFSADFVDDCLGRYATRRRSGAALILDPFAGVGTTLFQAFVRGFDVIGFEINPYAVLASRAKLNAVTVSPAELLRGILAFERFMSARESTNRPPVSLPPVGFSGRTELFGSAVERKVLFVLDFINRLENSEIADLFRVALGSVMVSFSNYSYEPSLTRRIAVGKPEIKDASVASDRAAKLRMMLEDVEWIRRHVDTWAVNPAANIHASNVLEANKYLRKRSVDLVVTSPPYLNNYHYPRNTRPQLHWLGLASGAGYNGARETESFGKFWQTVRELPPVPLTFRMRELQETIDIIRGLNTQKNGYGGPGWANYAATYFNDAHVFCGILAEALRPGGAAVIVLGNSIIQGVEVKTDAFFGRIAELRGLEFENTLLLRKKRTGSSIIRSSVRVDQAAVKTVLYESAIVLRKRKP